MFSNKRRQTLGQGLTPIHRQLPMWDLHGGCMILKDGRLLYGIYFQPPTHLHFTPDNLLSRSARLKSVFDLAIPDGETLSTYTSLRAAHEEAVADTRQAAGQCPDPVLSELTLTRARMLEGKIGRGEVSHWKFFLTATVTSPPEDRFSIEAPPSQAELERVTLSALAVRDATVAQLRAAGFGAQGMGDQDIFAESFFYLNPGWPLAPDFLPQAERRVSSVRRGQADQQTLIRQLTATPGNNLHPVPFIMGDQFVDVLSISRLPEYTETGYLREITTDLHGSYYVVVQATRESDYDVSIELEKKKNDLWSRVKGTGIVPNGKAVNLLEHVEQAQRLEGLESRFNASVAVVLIAPSRLELDSMKRRARGNITKLRGGLPISYGYQAQPQYFALVPFAGARSGYEFKPHTSNVIDLFPPVSPWPGFEEGAITYQNRDRSLIKFDLFTPHTITAHFAVYAPTGTGKTVLVQSLLCAELTKYPDAALIVTDAKQDFGYFFESLQDSVSILFGYGSTTRLNVFDLEDEAGEPGGEKLASLAAFVRIFAPPPADLREKGYEDIAIQEGVMAVYAQFRHEERRPQMSDLQRMLSVIENYTDNGKRMEDSVVEAARSVAVRLRKALGVSPVAPFVDCQTNIEVSARHIYLSLYGIPEDDDLMKRIANHIIKNFVWSRAKNFPRSLKKFIFFDEFENQIQTPDELDAVKRMLRVFRSFGVSFGMGTQSATASEYLGDLRDSFSHLFVGRYSREVAKDVVQTLSLPPVMEALLPTLNTVVGQYSEFALVVQEGADSSGMKAGDVIRVEESKLALWLFNSGNHEVAEKDRYVAQAGGDVIEGVKQLVTDKFGGYV